MLKFHAIVFNIEQSVRGPASIILMSEQQIVNIITSSLEFHIPCAEEQAIDIHRFSPNCFVFVFLSF